MGAKGERKESEFVVFSNKVHVACKHHEFFSSSEFFSNKDPVRRGNEFVEFIKNVHVSCVHHE